MSDIFDEALIKIEEIEIGSTEFLPQEYSDIKIKKEEYDSESFEATSVTFIPQIKADHEDSLHIKDVKHEDPLSLNDVQDESEKQHSGSSFKGFECSICKKTFPPGDRFKYLHHWQVHRKTIFPCNCCDKFFKSQKNYLNHLKISHNEEYSRVYPEYLQKYHHRKRKSNEVEESSESNVEEIQSLPCPVCKKVFTQPEHLTRHELTHDRVQRTQTQIDTGQHHTLDGYPLYNCNICHKKFKKQFNLQEHSKTHSIERPFRCTICYQSFKGDYILRKHLETHETLKTYTCKTCGKLFFHEYQLTQHIDESHLHTKPYECSVCWESFFTLELLNTHKVIHLENLKPYKCHVCKKPFPEQKLLNEHKRMHQFQCSICDLSFSSHGELKSHLKIFVHVKIHCCNICNEAFMKEVQLNQHKMLCHLKEYTQENCE